MTKRAGGRGGIRGGEGAWEGVKWRGGDSQSVFGLAGGGNSVGKEDFSCTPVKVLGAPGLNGLREVSPLVPTKGQENPKE